MTKRVLITGGDGFVAAHVMKRILDTTDWNIVAVTLKNHDDLEDRLSFAINKDTSKLNRIKTVECDLSKPISEETNLLFGKVDYLINLASESHVDRSISDPANFIINNVQVICNVLDWARMHKPEKILHVSTDEVFGPYETEKFLEWDTHLPSNPYSASKAAQEDIIFAYWRTYSVPVSMINIMNLVGECQNVEKFTPMVVSKLVNNEQIDIHTYDGGKVGLRYWLHAGNQASALLHVLSLPVALPSNSDKPNKFNVGGDAEYSNLEWAEKIANIMGKRLSYRLVDSETVRPGYDSRYGLDNSKLLSSGWVAPYNLELELGIIVQWYIDQQQQQGKTTEM
jgi:dTDP-glucose 4,6-dehydratase